MRVLVVGGGVASVSVCRGLTEEASPEQDVQPEILSEEPVTYYYRPKLPDYLAGSVGLNEIVAYGPGWYHERGIGYRTGVVVESLDLADCRVRLAGSLSEAYDKLVLATGGRAFLPPIPGSELRGVFALRTVGDADSIASYAKEGAVSRAVVIGGGLAGLECAAALAKRGLTVTVLEGADWILPRQLDESGAALLAVRMKALGVRVRAGVDVDSILADSAGRVEGVAFTRRVPSQEQPCGERAEAGIVLISAGMKPETSLATAAGLRVEGGIVVDDHMQTSAPGVYAIGDAAEHRSRRYGIVPAAIGQAAAAAAHILRGSAALAYAGTAFQTSLKVAGVYLTSMGDIASVSSSTGDIQAYARTTPDGGVYKKLFVKEGVLVGAILMGDRKGQAALTSAIATRATLSAAQIGELLA